MKHERQGNFERGGTAETGIFAMTLATDGEASDGHILSIEGAEIPERMPLLVSHQNDPGALIGRITHGVKELKSSPKRLRATGQIELEGAGFPAEIRRDMAHMIERGHLGAVSVRWEESEEPVRRLDLPEDHPAHVGKDERDARKRGGYFFPAWRALEGSVVALGADPFALIGRAEHGSQVARQFWRGMASEAGIEIPAESHVEIEVLERLEVQERKQAPKKVLSADEFDSLFREEFAESERRIERAQADMLARVLGRRA